MIFLKESTKTLQAALFVLALLGIYSTYGYYSFGFVASMAQALWFAYMAFVILGYFYFAFRLPKYLNPQKVNIPIFFLAILLFINISSFGLWLLNIPQIFVGSFFWFAIDVLISVYLIIKFRQFSK